MTSFIIALATLILGYFFYGRVVERFFGADDSKPTPAMKMQDGVDYTPMPTWKVFTIQFLNIAGLGPIFETILGAMYLAKVKKPLWMLSLPAAFMTTVTFTYLLVAPVKNGGFFLSTDIGYLIGLAGGIFSLILFINKSRKHSKGNRLHE